MDIVARYPVQLAVAIMVMVVTMAALMVGGIMVGTFIMAGFTEVCTIHGWA